MAYSARLVMPDLLSPVHVNVHVVTSNDERVRFDSLDPDGEQVEKIRQVELQVIN